MAKCCRQSITRLPGRVKSVLQSVRFSDVTPREGALVKVDLDLSHTHSLSPRGPWPAWPNWRYAPGQIEPKRNQKGSLLLKFSQLYSKEDL